MPNALWFIAQVADALVSMTLPENWEVGGDVSIESAVQAASLTLGSFAPMIGFIFPVVIATLPDNMLPCDGTTYDRVDYPDLYAVLDSAFIVDADTFKTPDLRGRTIIGSDGTYAVNADGGESAHTLVTAEMPSHTHTDTGHTHSTGNSILIATATPPPIDVLGPNPIPASTGSASANLTDTGGDDPHNNMQPYLPLKYGIIAL